MSNWHLKQSLKYAVAALPPPIREPWIAVGVKHVERAERWPADRVRDAQLHCLNRILRWAARHVPFYRELRMAATLPLDSLDDLRKWPVVDRATVAAHPALFHSDRFPPWRTRAGATTGRSGTALTVRWEWPGAVWRERAFHARLFRWAGLPHGCRRIVLRGGLVDGPAGLETRWWQFVPHQRALVLSVFQLSEATVVDYVRAMHRFRPLALQAYPSAAAKLARLARDAGIVIPQMRAVLTSSESLLPEDRRLIEECMNAPVFDFYGHAERAVAAAQCEHRQGHHLFEDYGYAELLDEAGSPSPEGTLGEIVATGFWNRAMPFIRYRTGDRAALAQSPCACGRSFRMMKILEGRPPDFLVASDGTRISLRFGLGAEDLAGIAELRFYQSWPGIVEVRYIGSSDAAGEERVRKALQRRTGDAISFRVQRVDHLPPGTGGKAVLVVHREHDA